jgi:predicted transposase/invertase (TIGR01784 family)
LFQYSEEVEMARKEKQVEDEEEYFLSPTIDTLFKRIFADRRSTEPICSLLSGILNAEVSDVQITNPEIPRDIIDAKGNVLDINAILNGTIQVNIEMQVCYQTHFMKRTQFNLARLYETQIKSGGNYANLQRTIVINIFNEGNYSLPAEKWHSSYIFKEEELNTPLPDGMMEIHFIQLQKMKRLGIIDESDLLTKWVLFMNSESMQEMRTIAKRESAIWEAYTIVEEVAKNEEERRIHEARQKFIRDQLTNQLEYEKREVEAEKRGREEGKIETAKAMIEAGFDIEAVCKATGLNPEDLT